MIFFTKVSLLILLFITSKLYASDLESIELLRNAETGRVTSQFNLALLLSFKGKHKDAHYWFKRAAKQNHPEACRFVGFNHVNGLGTSQNLDIAERWLLKAALFGDEKAIKWMHQYYLNNDRRVDSLSLDYFLRENFPEVYTTQSQIEATPEEEKIALQKAENWQKDMIYYSSPSDKKREKASYQRLELPNGDKFEGIAIEGVPNGIGKKVSSNGTIYQGEFKDGIEDGYGTWYNKKGTLKFQGIWKQGKPVNIKE